MTLSNDQIRVKVVELLGWTHQPTEVIHGWHVNEHWLDAKGKPAELPNYPLSLDACSEGFEKGLNPAQLSLYATHLETLVRQDNILGKNSNKVSSSRLIDILLILATPLQRCLAFIKTMENKL